MLSWNLCYLSNALRRCVWILEVTEGIKTVARDRFTVNMGIGRGQELTHCVTNP
jgi:hypothetical protein